VQLSQADITQQNKQQYLLSGTVDFSTVPNLMRQASGIIAGVASSDKKSISIDLSQVDDCNSAALALMLEIVKSARQRKVELHFKNLPAALLTIAKAYGVENEIREISK